MFSIWTCFPFSIWFLSPTSPCLALPSQSTARMTHVTSAHRRFLLHLFHQRCHVLESGMSSDGCSPCLLLSSRLMRDDSSRLVDGRHLSVGESPAPRQLIAKALHVVPVSLVGGVLGEGSIQLRLELRLTHVAVLLGQYNKQHKPWSHNYNLFLHLGFVKRHIKFSQNCFIRTNYHEGDRNVLLSKLNQRL